MKSATTSIEQQAKITRISGNVQLIRDGFFLPAQPGGILLPGDRVVSDANGKAVIEFTGVKKPLIIESGAAATFNLEVIELEQPPQWIATDLYGEGVYFGDPQQTVDKAQGSAANSGGTTPVETTGYPLLESVVFLGATAAIYSDNESNSENTEVASVESGMTGGNTGSTPAPATPQPNSPEEPAPESNAGPLDGLLEPVNTALDGLLGLSGSNPPISTLQASETAPNLVSNLIGFTASAS